LQVLDVHAGQSDRRLEVGFGARGTGGVVLGEQRLGDELVVLARGVDLTLPFLGRRTFEAQEPRDVVLGVGERIARVDEHRRVRLRIALELCHEQLELAPRVGQLRDEHLRLGALEAQAPQLAHVLTRQLRDRFRERALGFGPQTLRRSVAFARRDLARLAHVVVGERDLLRCRVRAQPILPRTVVVGGCAYGQQQPREEQELSHASRFSRKAGRG